MGPGIYTDDEETDDESDTEDDILEYGNRILQEEVENKQCLLNKNNEQIMSSRLLSEEPSCERQSRKCCPDVVPEIETEEQILSRVSFFGFFLHKRKYATTRQRWQKVFDTKFYLSKNC